MRFKSWKLDFCGAKAPEKGYKMKMGERRGAEKGPMLVRYTFIGKIALEDVLQEMGCVSRDWRGGQCRNTRIV